MKCIKAGQDGKIVHIRIFEDISKMSADVIIVTSL